MSDSVDRVFVHALATVRRLPRTGSSRPPPSSRLRLYGLYKQSMEGDVHAILPRPTLPISSPDPMTTNNAVHRYASRDVRTREAQAEIEKWDAWHACAGMSRVDAKREYISTLIETMKEYASGTVESRELVNELEFVWSQIRSQSGSGSGSGSEPGQAQSQGSPEGRKSERMLKQGPSPQQSQEVVRRSDQDPKQRQRGQQQRQQRPTRHTRTPSGLRVLPPVSQEDSNSINSAPQDRSQSHSPIEGDNDDDEAPSQPDSDTQNQPPTNTKDYTSLDLHSLQKTLETHITQLRTELAALREQLSTNNLLSASTYTLGHHYYSLSPTQRVLHRMKLFMRVWSIVVLKQVVVQLGILGVVVLVERVRGDGGGGGGGKGVGIVEGWVRRVLGRWKGKLGRWGVLVGWWVWGGLEWLGGIWRWRWSGRGSWGRRRGVE